MTGIICALLTLYLVAIFGRIIFSWFPMSHDSPLIAVRRFLLNITEPVLAPLRRALPPLRIGGMALDLSPIVIIIAIEVIRGSILNCA